MERRYKLSDFHHLEEIARGRGGSIHLVKEKATGKRFVLKKRLRSECRGKAEHEARLLRKIKHPNVIKCYGYFKTSSLGRSPVYIVLEYAVMGDLRKLIREREKPLGETRLWTMYRPQFSKKKRLKKNGSSTLYSPPAKQKNSTPSF